MSAFANSGGGHFVVGVDESGNADGGISTTVGRQGLRDWLDQAIHRVEPVPGHQITLIEDSAGRGTLE
ncbi:hypothetical protein KOR42_07380 [Thalassoglobus neptunius]|uniref:Divergent AAA domain protein n=2 Tax=Thalassoglobus neptunius TaxID=1938619 RepID=A0A5C5X3J9_9PLAN|nr:hypothetical protein KOR42_07380 [Thalassoglobus neptunius]